MRLGNLRIRWKLTLVIMVTSTMALLLASAGFLVLDMTTYRGNLNRAGSTYARLTALAVTRGLTTRDRADVMEALSALRARRGVASAAVYAGDGSVFARYVVGPEGSVPAHPLAQGVYQGSEWMDVYEPVLVDGKPAGTVFVRFSLQEWQERIHYYMQMVAGLLLAGMLLSLLVSIRIQQVVSEPILRLAGVMDRVSREKDYSLRVKVTQDDEVGALMEGFNSMLVEIAAREEALSHARDVLEERVQARTLDLEREVDSHMRTEAELEKAKEEAEAASVAKSQFLAKMSHELRTPLNAIIGYSEMLSEEASDGGMDEQVADLQKIHSAGKHLLALINDILDLSKIESGKMELFLEEFDVASVAKEVANSVRLLASQRGNDLRTNLQEPLGSMYADMARVRQCLHNLLTNACKFTNAGTVTLDVAREAVGGKEWLRFRVQDTGIGIAPEQMLKLFAPFSQAEVSTTSNYGGTGLGLAITRRFSQMMGGDVLVESEPAKGSTFTLLIPARAVPQAAGTGSVGASDVQPAPNTVLVVDDDKVARDLLSRQLARDGFRPVCAATGEEALSLAARLRPVAITLDALMPGMDGWAVLSSLKADPSLAAIPVIMVTVVENTGLGTALGAAEYLTKPVDRERLAGVLSKYRMPESLVLVIEDDDEVRALYRAVLEADGWRVCLAQNGREGLEKIAAEVPAVILLDLMMPEMDGFTFVEELRRHREWAAIPVVVMTAKSLTDADRVRLEGAVQRVCHKDAAGYQGLLRSVSELIRTATPAAPRVEGD